MMTRTPVQSAGQPRPQPAQPGQSAKAAEANAGTAQLRILEARRSELKSQLNSVTERRALLSVQKEGTEAGARRDLEARIRTLDERTARIDDELNSIDDAIANALANGATPPPSGFDLLLRGGTAVPTTPPPPPGQFDRVFTEGIIQTLVAQGVGFVLVGVVLWVALRRRVAGVARLGPEDVNRLEQLQRSVDVMAVEVERISEGQRYAAKILNDQQAAIGAGAAPDVTVRRPDAERVRAAKDTD